MFLFLFCFKLDGEEQSAAATMAYNRAGGNETLNASTLGLPPVVGRPFGHPSQGRWRQIYQIQCHWRCLLKLECTGRYRKTKCFCIIFVVEHGNIERGWHLVWQNSTEKPKQEWPLLSRHGNVPDSAAPLLNEECVRRASRTDRWEGEGAPTQVVVRVEVWVEYFLQRCIESNFPVNSGGCLGCRSLSP